MEVTHAPALMATNSIVMDTHVKVVHVKKILTETLVISLHNVGISSWRAGNGVPKYFWAAWLCVPAPKRCDQPHSDNQHWKPKVCSIEMKTTTFACTLQQVHENDAAWVTIIYSGQDRDWLPSFLGSPSTQMKNGCKAGHGLEMRLETDYILHIEGIGCQQLWD